MLDLRSLRKESRILQESSERFGFPPLHWQDIEALRDKKRTNTMFVLGSGSSINSFRERDWEIIRTGASFGINHWTLHSFVPDAYVVEPVHESRINPIQLREPSKVDHLIHLSFLGRPDVIEMNPMVIGLRPRTEFEANQLKQLPESLRANLRIYSRINPFTRVIQNLAGDLGALLRGVAATRNGVVVPDTGASVARLVTLGIVTGFAKIVLVGVDLTTEYFWQQAGARLGKKEFRSFDQPMEGRVHETMQTINRPFAIADFLQSVSKVSRIFGSEISTFKQSDPLSSILRSEYRAQG